MAAFGSGAYTPAESSRVPHVMLSQES